MPEKDRISVCICTFKRPSLLSELLKALAAQETDGEFDYEIVVVDNDANGSARLVVEFWANLLKVDLRYFIEPRQNIALARNKAVENARGGFVAFIDDDELPPSDWLLTMYRALTLFETSGVLGPVVPEFQAAPPAWVLRGKFFDRPDYFSGYFINWWLARTGNCLLRASLFEKPEDRFGEEFGSGGEDRDFFKRMIGKGHIFVWCAEAPIRERLAPERWNVSVMVQRALLRGKMTYRARRSYPRNLIMSFGAVLLYSTALPFLLVFAPVFGIEVFMDCLIKDCDHIGKLFALFGIDLVRRRYVVSLSED